MKKRAIVADVLKILLGITLILPVLLAVAMSFMPEVDIKAIPFKLKFDKTTLENYVYALKYNNLWVYLKNTFIIVIIELPFKIFTALLAAYAFSHFEFRCKNFLFALLLTVMMIPSEVIIMTLFKMVMRWGYYDTYVGLTIVHLVDVSAVFMFRQNMLSIPRSLQEAATIDGCGPMKYFFSILVPLNKTIVVAYGLRAFIATYNNFMWPLLITSKDAMRTVQTGVAQLSWSGGTHTGAVLASAIIATIIPLTVFFLGMDSIVEGMTAGAVKS